MSNRILLPLVGLSLLLAAVTASRAQDGKAKDPDSKYAMDLRARKAGEEDFAKETKTFGVEVYTDGPSGDALVLGESGSLAAVPAKLFKADAKVKEPLFRHGLALKVRPAGEKEWDKSKRFGIEVFKDDTSGGLVFISEAGAVAAVPAKYTAEGAADKGKPKNPTWKHAMDLRVRKAGEKDFNKDTRKFGVEVFHDENSGNLLYVSETGSFAVVPAALAGKGESGKGPSWQHGLELSVRKPGEKEFTKDTRKYGLEVFLDESTGNLVYLCETGAIAAVPGKFARATGGASKAPELKHAMDLSVRKAGEKEFTRETRKFGVEVYKDDNNGNVVYLSDSGDLAVVSPTAE